MSENNTERINGSRSFEEQVFARFDAVDRRFDGIEVRIERLEMKQPDTKPIWEQALIAIAETNAAMRNGFAIVGNAIDQINVRLDSMDKRFDGVDARLEAMDKRFDSVEARFEVIDKRFDGVEARFEAIDKRFDGVEARFEAMDKRFDGVDARFDPMDNRFDGVEARFETLSTDLNDGLRGVELKIEVLNQHILELKADQLYVDKRLQKN